MNNSEIIRKINMVRKLRSAIGFWSAFKRNNTLSATSFSIIGLTIETLSEKQRKLESEIASKVK